MHVEHPLLAPQKVAFRGYQANLARIAARQDTLVVLPTGLGKTIVAVLVLADALKAGASRLLLMAPTKPLVEQHARSLAELLAPPWNTRIHTLTGNVSPDKREQAYAQAGIVVATPQVVQNDIVAARLRPGELDWVVYDEAHRAVGDYPYVFIGAQVQVGKARRLGLTASPGHDAGRIDDVRRHLGLAHVEIRTPQDPDVAEYIQDTSLEWETLPMPPGMARVSRRLHDALAARVRALKTIGFLKGAGSRPRRMDLLEAGRKAQAMVQKARDPDPSLYQALSLQAQAMKIQHAIEQAETQGARGLVAYLDAVRKEAATAGASKASRAVAEDALVREALEIARHDEAENPKMERVATLIAQELEARPEALVIVFTQYRATCEAVAARLAEVPGARPVVFVGQGKRRGTGGLSQKQQAETLQAFADGTHNVLVATSVAEEGLDIPATDLVVFYEPIASEIRSIQRRGRTGRHRAGRVVVLMTKGTQDEAAHWTARRKERQMVQELHGLRASLAGRPAPGGQTTLEAATRRDAHAGAEPSAAPGAGALDAAADRPAPRAGAPAPGPKIVVDAREQGAVVRHLHELGAHIEQRRLDTADYVLSDRVAVERKTTADFVDSLIDGRLFPQLKQLRAYPRAFLVVEGASLGGHRNVAPEAVLAALASAATDFGVPVLRTEDSLETARFLIAVAKREQGREGRRIAIRPAPAGMDDHDRQLHLVAGLPGVDGARAAALLAHFGSAAAVFAASEQALAQVEKIGAKTAAAIRAVLDLPYTESISKGP